ncbi:MAG: hypothetical protein JWP13_642 [Candidatus Saccharibacteria bacterium]|nr:hypothetical protein [Candidatus Saccharibacteria bacterium]
MSEPQSGNPGDRQTPVQHGQEIVRIFLEMMNAEQIAPDPIFARDHPTPLFGYVMREEVTGKLGDIESPQEFITRDGAMIRGPVPGNEATFVPGDMAARDLAVRLGEAVVRYLNRRDDEAPSEK